ncbi:MAG: hypothetical protein HC905_23240 [Bacteroidales bacterium]|nr:hypothetical protein [Bacteroidales bacterium]
MGSYISIQGRYGYPAGSIKAWQTFGPLWGVQGKIGRRLLWNAGMGIGFKTYELRPAFALLSDFGINILL